MGKFKPSGATLHRSKKAAQRKAVQLKKVGFRAEVQPTSKTTQKRSPKWKWVVFRGQERRRQ